MTASESDKSPRLKARLAGFFYLLTFGGALGLIVRSGIIVRGDVAATARNILAREELYRASVVLSDLMPTAAYVCVTVLLYELLKPVNRTVSLLGAFVSLVGCATGAVSTALLFAPLAILHGGPQLAAFTPEQIPALAYASLRLYANSYTVGIGFFGLYCLSLGWLVFRSGFLPRVIGVLLAIAGLGWSVDSVTVLLGLPFAAAFNSLAIPTGVLGEGSLMLWLLFVGVKPRSAVSKAALASSSDRRTRRAPPAPR